MAFYRRGIQLGQLVGELVAHLDFPGQRLSTLETMARHLACLRDDAEIAAAERLEKAAALFQERAMCSAQQSPGTACFAAMLQAGRSLPVRKVRSSYSTDSSARDRLTAAARGNETSTSVPIRRRY